MKLIKIYYNYNVPFSINLIGLMRQIIFALLITSISFSQELLKPTKLSTPPIIDGELTKAEWQNVFKVSSFKTFSPDFGKDASQKTIAYAAYDSEHLYFAFRCYDTEPNKIKTSVANRDNILSDDWVCINLDSFNDQQSLYAFYINPNGIQADSRFAAAQEDLSADFVWHSAGKILSDGYSIEISIPLKSIRYAETNPVYMSIFFERYISRTLEHASFPELDPAKGMAFLVQMVPLEYHDLKTYTLFEILPAFTFSQKYQRNKNELTRTESDGEISITTKYGITSDLILDGTYNPDFSQVEADAGQVDVNLRSALYYAEKRPFFLEGNEIFNFAGTNSSIIDPIGSIVHTRNIVSPITGIKLSGKLGKKNTLAVLYAIDELPQDDDIISLKYASFQIARYKRSFKDDSYIGAVYTGKELENGFGRAGGVDGFIRLTQSGTIEWNGLLSSREIANSGIIKSGNAFSLKYKSDSRDIYYDATVKHISNDFNLDVGYLTRNGILAFTGLIRPKFYPGNSFVKRIDVEVLTAQTKDKPSSLWETYNHLSSQFYIFGSFTSKLRLSYSTEVFNSKKFNTGGVYFSFGGQFIKQLYMFVSYTNQGAIYYSSNPYQGRGNRISSIIVYKPSENIESFTNIVYSDFTRSSDKKLIYEYLIFRERLTYQFNQYLFFRGIIQYNKYRRELLTDFLVSFTYVPGTVMHLGYGSLYKRTEWDESINSYRQINEFRENQRGLFFKVSYLWRM